MKKFLELLDLYQIGDLASVASLLVALVGFFVTIRGVTKTKSAAQRAEQAAQRTREALAAMRSISTLSSVIAALEEVKRLHRTAAWPLLPDRYGSLRAKLIELRTLRPNLTENQKTTLQAAIQHLADMEVMVDRALAAGKSPANVPRLTSVVSGQSDNLTELLAQLQREEGHNG